MSRRKTSTLVAAALAVMATAIGCRDVVAPTATDPGNPRFHPEPPPEEQANFRLTGGGRVDASLSHDEGFEKNTPESRDFATFGFQARPTGVGTEGSGNITWVEHNPEGFGDGFTFHGRVAWFAATGEEGCGTFGGTGRLKRRDGVPASDGVEFTVEHACDVDEPGRGADHIRIILPEYERHGLLSGGNIQEHKL